MIYKMKKKSEINISIVILNFNSHEFTINCLKSIELSIDKYLEFEIIVVDNGSTDQTLSFIKEKFTSIKVIIEKNSGSGVVPYLPLPELKKKATN